MKEHSQIGIIDLQGHVAVYGMIEHWRYGQVGKLGWNGAEDEGWIEWVWGDWILGPQR